MRIILAISLSLPALVAQAPSASEGASIQATSQLLARLVAAYDKAVESKVQAQSIPTRLQGVLTEASRSEAPNAPQIRPTVCVVQGTTPDAFVDALEKAADKPGQIVVVFQHPTPTRPGHIGCAYRFKVPQDGVPVFWKMANIE